MIGQDNNSLNRYEAWNQSYFKIADAFEMCRYWKLNEKGNGINLDKYKKIVNEKNDDYIKANASISNSNLFFKCLTYPKFDTLKLYDKIRMAKKLKLIKDTKPFDSYVQQRFLGNKKIKDIMDGFMVIFLEEIVLRKKTNREVFINNLEYLGFKIKSDLKDQTKKFIQGKINLFDFLNCVDGIDKFEINLNSLSNEELHKVLETTINKYFKPVKVLDIKIIDKQILNLEFLINNDTIKYSSLCYMNNDFLSKLIPKILNQLSSDLGRNHTFTLETGWSLIGVNQHLKDLYPNYGNMYLIKTDSSKLSIPKKPIGFELSQAEINKAQKITLKPFFHQNGYTVIGYKLKKDLYNYFSKNKEEFNLNYQELKRWYGSIEHIIGIQDLPWPKNENFLEKENLDLEERTDTTALDLKTAFPNTYYKNSTLKQVKDLKYIQVDKEYGIYNIVYKINNETKNYTGDEFDFYNFLLNDLNKNLTIKKFYKIPDIPSHTYIFCTFEQYSQLLKILKN